MQVRKDMPDFSVDDTVFHSWAAGGCRQVKSTTAIEPPPSSFCYQEKDALNQFNVQTFPLSCWDDLNMSYEGHHHRLLLPFSSSSMCTYTRFMSMDLQQISFPPLPVVGNHFMAQKSLIRSAYHFVLTSGRILIFLLWVTVNPLAFPSMVTKGLFFPFFHG